jgi:hypothetical protein
MGNRATIEVKDTHGYSAGCYIYIHWLGDPETVTSMVRDTAHKVSQSTKKNGIMVTTS